ncbi:hypothetical protein [uncultured Clostridium sp.]|uniref:hypothetical protein n=1 Tax=uncultured Clostridium sp. TaxID=59620 RepID=UPI002625FCA1|nr:hypothetical protein [uncultured Clostridium sp.]
MKKLLNANMTDEKRAKLIKVISIATGVALTVATLPLSNLIMSVASGAAAILLSVGFGATAAAIIQDKLIKRYF